MADPVKRLHYFDHQFLREKDFTEEQSYHMRIRQLHNRLLHTWGIAEGLGLSFVAGASRVTISEGVAVDGLGREIVLPQDTQTPDLSSFAGKTVFVTLKYDEQQTDATSETGVTGNTRWTETPIVEVSEAAPADPSQKLILGRVTVGTDGKVSGTDAGVAPNQRRSAGVVGGDLEVRSLTLTDPGVVSTQWARMRLGAANRADLQSNLKVEGNIEVSGNVDSRDVSADGTKLDAHVGIFSGNPHGTTAAHLGALVSVDGVSNPGGNIDLVQANAIAIIPDDAGKRITIGENHSARTDNPHNTTAAQVGALPIGGGTIDGSLTVKTTFGHSSVFMAGQPFNGVRGAVGGTFVSSGFVSGVEGSALGSTTSYGVAAQSSTGNFALFVSGTAKFTGAKTGYVVDSFINASGQRLRTGDVVKLKGTPITRFQGDNNKIPVVEVALADKENDTTVIGIVDREAIPEQDVPDTRVGPEDPTFIENGGELFVVTLGTYAHCKVDASEAPIEVGDLLTSSSNPGHAKKATNPKIGSIIGKALEPIKERTGYIAVFVNIQ